jgi:hypothetical protein
MFYTLYSSININRTDTWLVVVYIASRVEIENKKEFT